MNFELELVSFDKRDVLFNLLQFALYDGCLFTNESLNDKGLFSYKWFDNYFIDNDRDAYFIKDGNKYLGFVMINEYLRFNNEGKSVAEFFIMPQYRRKHLGMKVAFAIFDMFPGYWEVKPIDNSREASLFWERVIGEYTGGNFMLKNDVYVFNIR